MRGCFAVIGLVDFKFSGFTGFFGVRLRVSVRVLRYRFLTCGLLAWCLWLRSYLILLVGLGFVLGLWYCVDFWLPG